jgi:hypothetical protein
MIDHLFSPPVIELIKGLGMLLVGGGLVICLLVGRIDR